MESTVCYGVMHLRLRTLYTSIKWCHVSYSTVTSTNTQLRAGARNRFFLQLCTTKCSVCIAYCKSCGNIYLQLLIVLESIKEIDFTPTVFTFFECAVV